MRCRTSSGVRHLFFYPLRTIYYVMIKYILTALALSPLGFSQAGVPLPLPDAPNCDVLFGTGSVPTYDSPELAAVVEAEADSRKLKDTFPDTVVWGGDVWTRIKVEVTDVSWDVQIHNLAKQQYCDSLTALHDALVAIYWAIFPNATPTEIARYNAAVQDYQAAISTTLTGYFDMVVTSTTKIKATYRAVDGSSVTYKYAENSGNQTGDYDIGTGSFTSW